MRFRLRTLLTFAMVATAVLAYVGCPLLDSPAVAWHLEWDMHDLSRKLAIVLVFASAALAFFALVAAFGSEERVPAEFWLGYFASAAFSALLWALTLPWIQAARE
ncbi:MAG TPA: hypothetical protein VFV87_05610 [Pirellulaceae bacterium]|nr:hypothetical protein [Pirellulaceae bacterium]